MGWKLWSRRPQVRIRAGDDQATDLLVGPASPDEFQRPTGLTSQEQMERDELVPILNPYSVVSPDIVQLSPSWEQRDLPGEHLNLENVLSDLDHDVDKSPPDRYLLVYLTFVLHGIGILMPWNMFINAKDYFTDYKLSEAYTGENSIYVTNFMTYVGYAAQIPNFLFSWINVFVQFGGDLTRRVVWSLFINVLVFIATVVMAMVDSSSWPDAFFWMTMLLVVLLNISNGIYQNTIYGMTGKLPFVYTGAVVLGSNISGTFTAIVSIISIALSPNPRTAAIYYFITALFVLLACFDTYFALPLNRFYRHYTRVNASLENKERAHPSYHSRLKLYFHVFKLAFPQLLNVFLVFFVTLAIFPSVYSDVRRSDENFFISPTYFTVVTCFFTFNFFAMLGNILSNFVTWPSPRWLWVAVWLRFLLIPFFLFLPYVPQGKDVVRTLPILIDSDWAYWLGGIVLGFTNGYFSSLSMMYCPRTVEQEYAGMAAQMGGACLVTGVFAGVNFQLVLAYVVQNWTL